MTCINKLASFPNSRIRTRRPTQTAVTYDLDVETADLGTGLIDTENDTLTASERNGQTTNDNTIVAEPDPLATYITLRNIDPAEPLYYTYVPPGQEDTIDVVAQGMLLRAGDAVDLEVTDSIVIAKGAHSDGTTAINARVDKGIG
jgi:hypothetical protein